MPDLMEMAESLTGRPFVPSVDPDDAHPAYLGQALLTGKSIEQVQTDALEQARRADLSRTSGQFAQGDWSKWWERQLGGFKPGGESTHELLGREVVPLAEGRLEGRYREARERYQKAQASDQDLALIARYESIQKTEQEEGTARGVMRGLAGVPKILLEATAGGRAVAGGKALLGLGRAGAAAAEGGGMVGAMSLAPQRLIPALARQAPGHLATGAMTTPALVDMYYTDAQQRATRNGGEWYDAKNVTPAAGYAVLQAAVLGHAQRVAAGAASTLAGRAAAGGGVGVLEQTAGDTAASLVDDFLIQNDAYKVGAKYGAVAKALRGEPGSAKELATQIVTFSLLSALQGSKPTGRGAVENRSESTVDKPNLKSEVLPRLVEVVEKAKADGKKVGLSEQAVERQLSVQGQWFERLTQTDPATAWETARESFLARQEAAGTRWTRPYTQEVIKQALAVQSARDNYHPYWDWPNQEVVDFANSLGFKGDDATKARKWIYKNITPEQQRQAEAAAEQEAPGRTISPEGPEGRPTGEVASAGEPATPKTGEDVPIPAAPEPTAVRLGPGSKQRVSSGFERLEVQRHDLLGPDGKPIGFVNVIPEGENLKINWIGLEGAGGGEAAGKLGSGQVRVLFRQLAEAYPDAKTVTGLRAGGVHKGEQRGVSLDRYRQQAPPEAPTPQAKPVEPASGKPPYPFDVNPPLDKPGAISAAVRKTAAVESVPVGRLVGTQSTVNPEYVKQLAGGDAPRDPSVPTVIRHPNGRDYIDDGHHKIASQIANGADAIRAKVIYYDPQTKTYSDKPAEPPPEPKAPEPAAPEPKPTKPKMKGLAKKPERTPEQEAEYQRLLAESDEDARSDRVQPESKSSGPAELPAALEEAVNTGPLTKDQRDALIAVLKGGRSYEEIGKEFGVRGQTIKNRADAAAAKMRAEDPNMWAGSAAEVRERFEQGEAVRYSEPLRRGEGLGYRRGAPGSGEKKLEEKFGRPLTAAEKRQGAIGGGAPEAGEAARVTAPPPQTETALANAKTDAERVKNELEAIPEAERVTNAAVVSEAAARVEADPNLPFRLVDQLADDMRPTSVEENAILLRHKVALSNEYERVLRQFNEAMRTGDRGLADRLETQEAEIKKLIDKSDRVNKAIGTQAGRSLQFRRQMMAEDFSLTGMLLRAEYAARRPLTPEEKAKVTQAHEKLAAADTRLAEAEDATKTPAAGVGTAAARPKGAAPEGQPGDMADLRIATRKARTEFGETLAALRRSAKPPLIRAASRVFETANIFRALQTAYDFSGLLRQAGFMAMSRPIRTAKAVPGMFKAFASERAFDRQQDAIRQRPNTFWYDAAGLFLADVDGPLTKAEEGFGSRLAEKIPGVKASARAYAALLNRVRADAFDAMMAGLSKGGKPTVPEAKALAHFVNVATGRGTLGQLEPAAGALANAFFSPRYVASRFQILAGQPLLNGSWRTRRAVAQEYARMLGGLAAFYTLAALVNDDEKITFDPRSADFGKVRFGNARLDPLFGLAQVTTLGSRVLTGETVDQRGNVKDLRRDVFGLRKKAPAKSMDNTADVIWRFVRSKGAPVPAAALDLATGETVVGEKVRPAPTRAELTALAERGELPKKSVATNLVTPLSLGQTYEVMLEQGMPRSLALTMLGVLGMGVQVHQKK